VTPEGEKLDRFLAQTIAELKGMPELGGKKLVSEVAGSFADVRKALGEARLSMAGAVNELLVETARIGESEKVVRSETAAIRKMNDDVLGNAASIEQTTSES
jgi:hypothetical protein